jgi:hypothetical protein
VNPIAGKAANQFVVGSSSATNFIIKNSGNVGIGRTDPTGTLSVARSSLDSANIAYFGDEIAYDTTGGRNQIVLGNTDGESAFQVGQDATHALNFWWQYNATADNAIGTLETYAGILIDYTEIL